MDVSTSGERIQGVDGPQVVVELLGVGGVRVEQCGRGVGAPDGRLHGEQVAALPVVPRPVALPSHPVVGRLDSFGLLCQGSHRRGLGRHLDDALLAAGMVRGARGRRRRLPLVLGAPPRCRPQELSGGHRGENSEVQMWHDLARPKRLPKSSNSDVFELNEILQII